MGKVSPRTLLGVQRRGFSWLQAANELLKRQLGSLRAGSGRAARLAEQLDQMQASISDTCHARGLGR